MISLWPLVIIAHVHIVIDLHVDKMMISSTKNIFQQQLCKTLMQTIMILVLSSVKADDNLPNSVLQYLFHVVC